MFQSSSHFGPHTKTKDARRTGGAENRAPLAARTSGVVRSDDSEMLFVHLVHLHALVTLHAHAALHHLPVHHHHLPLRHLRFFPVLRHYLAVHRDLRAVGHGRRAIHLGNLLPVMHNRHLAILHYDAVLLGGHNGGGNE